VVENYWASQVEPFYQRPVGFNQRAAAGIQAQHYLSGGKLRERDLAELVVARWADAKANGRVAIDELPDLDAVLGSSEAAAPLTELMLAQPKDGAVAILIASEDAARRSGGSPVFITGMGSSTDCHAYADRDRSRLRSLENAAAMSARAAGWDAASADIAEISSSSVVSELMALEALGLAGKGDGLSAARGGKVAVNRSGGALPADPIMATGLFRLAEAVRQLREPQLYGGGTPSKAVVHGSTGVAMQSNCVFSLEV
jgi:acetyl-CoA C-acetyltransferase